MAKGYLITFYHSIKNPDAMAEYAARHDGFFTVEDFARQAAWWDEPIVGTYRDVTLYQTPPPTQGFTVLTMLNLLEAYDVASWQWLGADHVHHLVQAKQIAYHDRDRRLADPRYASIPLERLIDRSAGPELQPPAARSAKYNW